MANPRLPNGLASPQSIYEEHIVTATNQSRAEGHHRVGTRAFLDDGRVFYYASNGVVALTTGSLLAAPATIGLNRSANHDKIILTESFGNFTAGAKDVIVDEGDLTTDDIIENEYKDGYLHVQDVTGEGQMRKINGHSAFDAAGSAATGKFRLSDPLSISLAATSQISLARNRHDRVIASSTAEEEALVGVAPIAVTASVAIATSTATAEVAVDTTFFWAQTWGPAAVQVSTTTPLVGVAFVSGTTAKMVLAKPATNTAMANWGVGLQTAGAASDFVLVDLHICP